MRDPDDILIDELHAPPPLDVAREALAYWRHRRDSLPWIRRAARRDAAEMVARWEQRVREAERAQRAGWGPLGLLYALAIDWPAAVLRRLPSRRRTRLLVGGTIAALSVCLVAMAVTALAVAYAVVSHL